MKYSGKIFLPLLVLGLVVALWLSSHQLADAKPVNFTTIEGKQLALQDFHGQWVLINFWATDCPSCTGEMPDLIQTWQEFHQKGLTVIAVAMPYDDPAQIKQYVAKNRLPFHIVHDQNGLLSKQFDQVRVTPTSFLIDGEGRIVQTIVGVIDFKSLKTKISQPSTGT